MKKHFFFTLLFSAFIQVSFAQCILSVNDTYNSSQINTYITNNCPGATELVIADGVTIGINGSWDLTGSTITQMTIKGSGSIEFGNADDFYLISGASLVVENTSNIDALKIIATNPSKIRIGIGTKTYFESDFAAIIAAGGADENGVLPVELTKFSSTINNGKVNLNWETASETNNWGFEIQRRGTHTDWQSIAFEEGQGESTEITEYSFLDNFPNEGVNYYRLKIIDYNGEFEYSPIITVIISETKKDKVSITPNPTGNIAYINTNSSSTSEVRIFDANGRLLKFNTFTTSMELNCSELEDGFYYVQITTDNKTTTEKLVVLKI